MEYIIRLPWPPSKSSPNGSQGDYQGKAAAGRKYKDQCGKVCMAQRVRRSSDTSAKVEVTFHPPRNGRFDLDNALAKAKRGLDAVSEAIGIDDGFWDRLELQRGEKVSGGCVVVHLRTYTGENNA